MASKLVRHDPLATRLGYCPMCRRVTRQLVVNEQDKPELRWCCCCFVPWEVGGEARGGAPDAEDQSG